MPLKVDDEVIWRGPSKPDPTKKSDARYGLDIARLRVQRAVGDRWRCVVLDVLDEGSGLSVGQLVTPMADKLFPAPADEPEELDEPELVEDEED